MVPVMMGNGMEGCDSAVNVSRPHFSAFLRTAWKDMRGMGGQVGHAMRSDHTSVHLLPGHL